MMSLEDCIKQLDSKKKTHPHLTDMWIRYLFQKKPTNQDLIMCRKAVGHMDNLPDVTPQQAFIIYSMMSFLFTSSNQYEP